MKKEQCFQVIPMFRFIFSCTTAGDVIVRYISALRLLTLLAQTPQNNHTHSNNSSAFANELFERV